MNLAGKIRQVRKNKGLKQKEFIKEVSEKLGLGHVLNESLAAQWESNLKNRANPTPDQIKAIAQISAYPHQTMWWFMRDDLKDNRAFELFPNGQFLLAMEGMNILDAEEYFASAAAQPQFIEARKAPLAPELTAWIDDTEKMWDLYVPFKADKELHTMQLQALALRREIPGPPCHHCNSINSNIAKKCVYCGKPLQIRLKKKTDSAKAARVSATVSFTQAPSTAARGDAVAFAYTPTFKSDDIEVYERFDKELSKEEFEQITVRRKEVMRRFGPIAEDLAEFPKVKGGLEQAGLAPNSDFRTQMSARRSRDKDFWSSVMFFLSSDFGANLNNYFNQSIQSGQFKEELRFFDGDNAVLGVLMHNETEMRHLGKEIQTMAMRLIFIDRMRKRTNKKLIIVYTHETKVNFETIKNIMDESVQSAGALGITVKFASGPFETANLLLEQAGDE